MCCRLTALHYTHTVSIQQVGSNLIPIMHEVLHPWVKPIKVHWDWENSFSSSHVISSHWHCCDSKLLFLLWYWTPHCLLRFWLCLLEGKLNNTVIHSSCLLCLEKKICIKFKRIKVICGVSNDLSVPLLSVFNIAIAVTFCNFTN